MTIATRIANLERALSVQAHLDDESVAESIGAGTVDDRHLAWIDAVLRPVIQVQLVTFAFGIRMGIDVAEGGIDTLDTPTGVGVRVLATRADSTLTENLEHQLTNGLYYLDLPDPLVAYMALGAAGQRTQHGQAWLLHRLVGQALGPDLGLAIRAELDKIVDLGRPLGSLLDLRRPHPAIWKRVEALVAAFTLHLGVLLVPPDDMWPLLEQLAAAPIVE